MGGKGSGRRKQPGPSGDEKKQPLPPREEKEKTPPPVRGKARGIAPGVDHESFSYRSIEMGKELMSLPQIDDWSDAEVLENRFFEILEILEKWQIPPNVSNVALGFGMDSANFMNVCLGRRPRFKCLTRKSLDVCGKIYSFLKQNLENSLIDEAKNPVKWIFYGKNYFGYTDQTETVVKHVDEKPELPQSGAVVGKYAGLVGAKPQELPEAELLDVEDVPDQAETPKYETPEGQD